MHTLTRAALSSLTALALAATPALAGGNYRGGGYGGYHGGYGYRGGGWYGPGWGAALGLGLGAALVAPLAYGAYYGSYAQPYSYGPAPTYSQPQPWLYCQAPAGYYPYIQQCLSPWLPVLPH
jgi:hypothetical protein